MELSVASQRKDVGALSILVTTTTFDNSQSSHRTYFSSFIIIMTRITKCSKGVLRKRKHSPHVLINGEWKAAMGQAWGRQNVEWRGTMISYYSKAQKCTVYGKRQTRKPPTVVQNKIFYQVSSCRRYRTSKQMYTDIGKRRDFKFLYKN